MEYERRIQKTKIMYLVHSCTQAKHYISKEKLSKQDNVFFFCFFSVGVYTKTSGFFFSLAVINLIYFDLLVLAF